MAQEVVGEADGLHLWCRSRSPGTPASRVETRYWIDGDSKLPLGPWDAAAGCLLVEEACGRVTNLRGDALDLDAPALVASDGRIHDAMLAILKEIIG